MKSLIEKQLSGSIYTNLHTHTHTHTHTHKLSLHIMYNNMYFIACMKFKTLLRIYSVMIIVENGKQSASADNLFLT